MDLKKHINNPKIQKCISDTIERDNKHCCDFKIKSSGKWKRPMKR